MSLIEFVLAALGIWGQKLVSGGNKNGYWFWLLSSTVALPFYLGRGMLIMAGLQVFYAAFNIRSLLK